jgi:alanyl-tRNA synthetase
LREILGKHVTQKGSLVAHDRFRFDISHPQLITLEQRALIEDRVNQVILANSEVKTVLMSTEEAIENGAMALFGEKYDSEVRVVSMGIEDYSVELCGGTHVSRTGDIGAFKILSEGAIAAGVRRIEAITGKYVIQYMRDNDSMLSNIAELLKSPRNEITEKLSSLLENKKILEKELSSLKISNIGFTKESLAREALKLSDNLRLLFQNMDNADPKLMRQAAEDASKLAEDIVAVFASKAGEKISIIVAVSKSISGKYSAVALAKHLATSSGITGGGGSDTLAQAGGSGDMDLKVLKDVADKWLSVALPRNS